MNLSRLLTGAVLASLVTAPVPAHEPASVVRGTTGLVAVPFRADNEGATDLRCSAALAHWYSQDLGTAPVGRSVRGTLWVDPAGGEVFLLNELEDRMPVETLWCGAGEPAWTLRSTIALEHRAGVAPAAVHVVCRPEGDRLACR